MFKKLEVGGVIVVVMFIVVGFGDWMEKVKVEVGVFVYEKLLVVFEFVDDLKN